MYFLSYIYKDTRKKRKKTKVSDKKKNAQKGKICKK